MVRLASIRLTSPVFNCFRTVQAATSDLFLSLRDATEVPQVFSAGVRSTAAPVSKTSDGYIEPGQHSLTALVHSIDFTFMRIFLQSQFMLSNA